jgi:type I restriction enzyme R subunit
VRKRLRALVKLIDKQKRKPIYTDFEDQMGIEASVDLPGFAAPDSFERFRAKARAFLKQHEDHIAIHKLRMNKALTAADLAELERMLAESGAGGIREIDRAKEESRGLGYSCAPGRGWTERPPRKRWPASSRARRSIRTRSSSST